MPDTIKNPIKDPAILLSRISEAFPDMSWTSYRYIDEGWDHEVIILDERVVFRFPNDEEYLGRLGSDIELLRALKPLVSVRIPEYTHIAPDGSFAGYPIIPGKILTKDVFDSLGDVERDAIASQLAGFLTTLHTLDPAAPAFRSIKPQDMVSFQVEMHSRAREFLPHALSEEDLALALQILDETDAMLSRPIRRAIVHCDIYYSHLLWDPGTGRLGVIDFSDMCLGDPAEDFAELYLYGEEFVRQVYDRYTGLKDDTLLSRAWTFERWIGVFLITNHFVIPKSSFEEARKTFDWVKARPRG